MTTVAQLRALRGAILLVVVTLALAGAVMWVNLPGRAGLYRSSWATNQTAEPAFLTSQPSHATLAANPTASAP